jgi:uncharacterized protein with von Willebrand factor type A (vWA) domain
MTRGIANYDCWVHISHQEYHLYLPRLVTCSKRLVVDNRFLPVAQQFLARCHFMVRTMCMC